MCKTLSIKLSDEDDILKELRTLYIYYQMFQFAPSANAVNKLKYNFLNNIVHLCIILIYGQLIENLFIPKFVLLVTTFLENF